MDFYQTIMGSRFFDSHVPALIVILQRIADALEEQNTQRKEIAQHNAKLSGQTID